MNQINLIGRLVRDCDVRYTDSGKVFNRFMIAVDRPYRKDQPKETDFIPCTAFGKTGETIGNYFSKGSRIFVTGKLRIDSYTAKDGSKKNSTSVTVDSFEFIDSRSSGSTGSQAPASGNNAGGFEGMGTASDYENIPF